MRRLFVRWLVVLATVLPFGLVGSASEAGAAGCDSGGSPTATVYLPNITKTLGGPTGWVTPFIVQNIGAATANLEISFYGFTDGSLVACRMIAGLAPGMSYADVPNNDPDLPGDSQFAVVVRSFGAQVVSVVNEHQGAGPRAEAGSYVGLSSGANRVFLPWVSKDNIGNLTTFIVQNLGTGQASVMASFTRYEDEGPFTSPSPSAAVSRSIAPGRSAFVDPRVEPALAAGSVYAVSLVSNQPIGVIANMHKDAPGDPRPTLFSYNGVGNPTSPSYLPYVPRNFDGRTAVLLVQNTGATAATPTLTFYPLPGGAVVSLTATAPVLPGGAWAFSPRFQSDGISRCPPSGEGGCLPEGEWSAVLTGGSFAALAAIGGATSAYAYTAVSTGTRVYLPNVTRTLGGTSGWTTPIVVQSAGASSATVRWYRFEDGERMQTQRISGMTPGASVKIDPRTVGGLTEGTQYAVIVDSPGVVGAAVLEFNFQGGDGTMAYEGFATSGAGP